MDVLSRINLYFILMNQKSLIPPFTFRSYPKIPSHTVETGQVKVVLYLLQTCRYTDLRTSIFSTEVKSSTVPSLSRLMNT